MNLTALTPAQLPQLQQLKKLAQAIAPAQTEGARDSFQAGVQASDIAREAAGVQAPAKATFVHPDSTGRIRHLALQLDNQASPEIKKEVRGAWTTLFKTMEPDTKFTISLENDDAKKDFQQFLASEKIENPERFNVVVAKGLNITMWARDQMVGLGNVGGGNTLLGQTTMRPHGDDELLPPLIAGSVPGLNFDPDKRLQTDGGDEVSNPKETFLGYASLYLTAKRLYESSRQNEAQAAIFSPFEKNLTLDYANPRAASPDFNFEPNTLRTSRNADIPNQETWMAAAHSLFEQKYGTKITIIGDDDPTTPIHEQPATFHMDMGMTPIESDRILVGDPSLALNVLKNLTPEEYADHNARLSSHLGLPQGSDPLGDLVEENTTGQPELQHNFDVNAKKVAAEGYEVGRLPYLQGPSGLSWVTYNNCLMESFNREDGTPVRRVFLPTYDLPALDKAAREVYEKQGYEVHPLVLPALTSWRGAIRCISNVLDRDTSTPAA